MWSFDKLVFRITNLAEETTMINRNLTVTTLLAWSAMLLFPHATNAHNLDRTVYPGHLCEFSGVPIPGSTRKAMWRRFGNGLFNMDNRFWVYVCPILRTHSPRFIERIVAVVEDAHPVENPRCRLITSSGRGPDERVTPYKAAEGAARVKDISMPLTDFPATARNLPLLQMECVIPAFTGEPQGYSGILSYSVEPLDCGIFACEKPTDDPIFQ